MVVRMLTTLIVLGGWVGAAGCAAPPDRVSAAASPDRTPAETGAPADDFPPDLALEVIVRRGRDVPARPEAHLRPARFVLFPDGRLQHRPVRTWATRDDDPAARDRVLPRRQVAGLWSLLGTLGLADASAGREPFDLESFPAPPGATAYLVAVTANGVRRVHVTEVAERASDDAAGEPPEIAVVRRLAALAWATDRPRPRYSRLTGRNDFGPDPYARYREP